MFDGWGNDSSTVSVFSEAVYFFSTSYEANTFVSASVVFSVISLQKCISEIISENGYYSILNAILIITIKAFKIFDKTKNKQFKDTPNVVRSLNLR